MIITQLQRAGRTLIGVVAAALLTGALGLAAQPAAATRPIPAQASWSSSIYVGTHNMHYAQATFNNFADVIGWQEVEQGPGPVADPLGKLHRELGPEYTTFAGGGAANAVPISWRSSMFSLVNNEAGCAMTHAGEAGVTPNRYFCTARLRHLPSGREFVFVNTHLISSIYTHPERIARWQSHMDQMRSWIQRQTDAGRVVVVVGDFNNQRRGGSVPGLMNLPGVRSLMDAYATLPLDQMYASNAILATNAERLPTWGSDHAAYRTKINLPT